MFDSLQVQRNLKSGIISYKKKMSQELPNNLRLGILENLGMLGDSQNWVETGLVPSLPFSNKTLAKITLKQMSKVFLILLNFA